jgi:hypothetical protein
MISLVVTRSSLFSIRRFVHVSRITIYVCVYREAGPGDPAAHRTGCLPLLPSGPGGVHRVPLHRAQPLFSCEALQKFTTHCLCLPARIYYGEKKRGQHAKTNMAERVGFEPTVPLPGRMLSKHVDSSTLAPLRAEKYKGWHLSMRVHGQQGERIR